MPCSKCSWIGAHEKAEAIHYVRAQANLHTNLALVLSNILDPYRSNEQLIPGLGIYEARDSVDPSSTAGG